MKTVFPPSSCSVGLVLPLWSDTLIHLDGDGWADFQHALTTHIKHQLAKIFFLTHYASSVAAHRGFSVSTDNRVHVFKPVSVQAMWWVILLRLYRLTLVDIFIVCCFLSFAIYLKYILFLTGQPCSHSIKPARWLVAITTSREACSSPGSATIRAGSAPTRPASTSGTPCRMCSRTALTRPCSSPTCKSLSDVFSFLPLFSHVLF